MTYAVATLSHGLILPAGAGLPPGYVEPIEADVRIGVRYGEGGVEFRGLLLSPRSAAGGLYPHRATIEAATRTADGMGNITEAWAAATENIPCAVRTMSVEERASYGLLEYISGYRIYMASNTVAEETHRINWGGQILRVLAVNAKTNLLSGATHHLEIDAYAAPEDN